MKVHMKIDYGKPVAEQEIPFRIVRAYAIGSGLKHDSILDDGQKYLLVDVPTSDIGKFVDDMICLNITEQVTMGLTESEEGTYYDIIESAGFDIEFIDEG